MGSDAYARYVGTKPLGTPSNAMCDGPFVIPEDAAYE